QKIIYSLELILCRSSDCKLKQPLKLCMVFYIILFFSNQKNWTDAQTYCREHYADLATAENDRDMNKIQREAQRLSFTSDAWVGLYNDIKSWRCSHDELPPGWTRWGPYQPNNVYGKDECVSMFQDGTWNDFPCLTPYPFVCYDGEKYF
uniref:C-type lectin domain-containing protein n=1 Tax=Astyanax mexicanus TaxID=7994 RepID=A0A8B9LP79_ASTMX